MIYCSNCKHVCVRDDGTMFCNLELPSWLYDLLPDDKFHPRSQDTTDFDSCAFAEKSNGAT